MQSTKFSGKIHFSAQNKQAKRKLPGSGKPLGLGSKPRIIVGSLRRQGGFFVPVQFPSHEWRSREIRAKLLPPQSPGGFSALALLYYLARPTKTAMLRRLHISRRHLRPKLRIARKCDGVFKKTEPQQTLNSLFSCMGSSVKDT